MKKLLLSLVALLATVGAWAQSEPVLADGVYTIQADVDGRRGYLAATDDYDRPVLADISWKEGNTDYTGNSASNVLENSKNWYVSTKNGVTYLYNVAKGKFIYDRGIDEIYFGDPFALCVTEYNGYIHVGSGTGTRYLSMGCGAKAPDQVKWEKHSANDGGCLLTFKFVENGTTTFATQVAAADKAIALAPLQKLIAVANSYEAGTNFGDYTEASVNALKAAIEEAEAKVEAGNVTDADIEELQAAIDALQVVLPDPDKFYVLKCNHENRYIYVNAANKLQWTGTAPTKVASNYVWKFVAGSTRNTVKMLSVHTQSYLNTVNNNDQATFGEGVDVTIKKASVDGAYVFEAGNAGIGLHAHGSYNTVIGYTNTAGANPYFFEEVEEFAHTLSVTSDWATLVLGFNATIPSGVEVYSVSETSGKSAKLEAVTGVVPANEAVLVKANNGNYTFGYTTTEGNIVDNKLEGTLFTKNITPAPGTSCYVLSNLNGEVGFYKATLNQNENTAFQNNANKAYLPVANVNAARFLSFDFGTETAIEGVEAETATDADAVVYDLAGRRVKAAQKGLYIVNGKVVIK